MVTAIEKPIPERLRNGAVALGNLWRSKVTCPEGWRADECSCAKKMPFCAAKVQWLMLAVMDGRDPVEGDYGLAIMMSGQEWGLTGLRLAVDIPEAGQYKIGRGGDGAMVDFVRLAENPKAALSVLVLMKSFPGSKMEFPQEETVPA
jgi:hypothetical protein